MKRFILVVYGSFFLAVAALMLPFGGNRWWLGIVAGVFLAGLWILSIRTRRDGLLHAAWLLTILCAIFGALNGAGKAWMLASVILSLAAWDLAFFQRRLDPNMPPETRNTYQRNHLKLLGIFIGLSTLAAAGTMLLQLQIGYGWLFLLGLAAVISLSHFAIQWQRRMRQ